MFMNFVKGIAGNKIYSQIIYVCRLQASAAPSDTMKKPDVCQPGKVVGRSNIPYYAL